MKDTKKVAPATEATEAEKNTSVVSATENGLSREKLPEEQSAFALNWAMKKVMAAFDPGTDSLFKGMRIVEDIAKRRRAKMYLIAERVRQLFVPDGITTQPIKGHSSNESCDIDMTFGQGTYIDYLGKKREHKWRISLENEDYKSEGDCPECEGELETEILDDRTRRIACDDCGYEVPMFCGVEVREL